MNVAFLQLHRGGDHYHFDLFDVCCATDLHRRGHRAEVVTFTMGAADEEAADLARVACHLDERAVELLFVERLWHPRLLLALRRPGRRIVALFAPGCLDWSAVDFVVTAPCRATIRRLVEALAGGGSPDGLPWLLRRGGTRREAPAPRERLRMRDELRELRLDYSLATPLSPERPPPEIRKHVVGNWGCAYRRAANRTGFLDAISLPEGVVATGCTFCDRPDTDLLPPGEVVDSLMGQLGELRAAWPRIDKTIVIDEYGLRYVDRFARAARERGYAGTYLWSGRADHVLRWGERLERAAERAPELRHVVYCLGIENFSDAELERMNKGLTAADLFRALAAIDGLVARHSNVAVEDSFGFILFTPWTTVADLRENLAAFRRLRFDRFRAAAVDTFLRLYPQTALYHRAAADGLLLDPRTTPGHAERYGYEADLPWRFADPRVAAIVAALGAARGRARLARLARLVDSLR